MDLGIDKAQVAHYKALAVKYLSDPVKLRLTVVGTLMLAAIVAVYMPFSDKIQQARAMAAAERTRADVIGDVESLRKEVRSYQKRIGKNSDTNEWVQYILGGLRRTNVKLKDMSSRPPRKVGPYRAISLTMEVDGDYEKIKDLMAWLEQSERLLRIETMQCQRRLDRIQMKIGLLGLVRKTPAKRGKGRGSAKPGKGKGYSTTKPARDAASPEPVKGADWGAEEPGAGDPPQAEPKLVKDKDLQESHRDKNASESG